MKKIVWFWMFTLMALGCVRTLPEPEVRTEIPFPEGERVEVSFTVTGAGLTPATRALGEEGIHTMHLAVFGSSGYLKEYVKATNLTEYQQDGRTCYRFGVSLTLSESPRTIHFIGNGPASLPFGDAKAIIRAHRDFRKMRKNYTSQPEVNLLKALPEERVNIITAHYLHGIKRFTELKISD